MLSDVSVDVERVVFCFKEYHCCMGFSCSLLTFPSSLRRQSVHQSMQWLCTSYPRYSVRKTCFKGSSVGSILLLIHIRSALRGIFFPCPPFFSTSRDWLALSTGTLGWVARMPNTSLRGAS